MELHEHPLIWPLGKTAAIAYVDNVFTEEFCNNFIQLCLDFENESHYGKTMGGVALNVKVTDDWYLTTVGGDDVKASLMRQEFDTHISTKLWKIYELYRQTFPTMRENINSITHDTKYQIQRYRKNVGYYSQHMDGAPWLDVPKRVLGVVVYLNTVKDGGGTEFSAHNYVIPAVAGRVSLFPAYWTHPHGSQMPLSNDKWIISTFVECGGNTGCGDPNCGCSRNNLQIGEKPAEVSDEQQSN